MPNPTAVPIAELRAAGCRISRTYSGGWSVTPPNLTALLPALADLGATVTPDQRRVLLHGQSDAVARAMTSLRRLVVAAA